MAASSTQLIVCRFGCDFISMCIMVFTRGLMSPAPKVGFPLTCEPCVYTKSCGFHFRLWDRISAMSGGVGGLTCVDVSVLALLLCILASSCDVSIIVVFMGFLYSWVRAMFRVPCIRTVSSRLSALEFATRYMLRLYFICAMACMVLACGSMATF
jgi:hypothetical protein